MRASKKISIKTKITLLSTLLMLFNALIVIIIAFALSNNVIKGVSEKELIKYARDHAQKVVVKPDYIKYAEDFDFVNNGIYTLILAGDGAVVAGSYPVSSAVNIGIPSEGFRSITLSSGDYYVVDVPVILNESEQTYWIRSIQGISETDNFGRGLLRLLFFLMPLFVIITAFSCYMVVKSSFSPIDAILISAAKIQRGTDLSQRINLDSGQDEIHLLAQSFDEMFERLEISFKRERQFTSDASHELRTPTAVILAQCDYLLHYSDEFDEYKEGVATIKEQARTMKEIIESMLTLARLDQNDGHIDTEIFDLSALLADITEKSKDAVAELVIETDIAENIFINGNASLLSRAINNLLTNAYKYGGEYAKLMLKSEGKTCVISVCDEGEGIDESSINQIFDRFYQVDTSRGQNKGYGLGLALVKQIITLHKGEVFARNNPEKGSTFFIKLPIPENTV